MAEIQPFKMVHYNHDLTQELGKLITPPYDVISPQEQDGFYQAHPLNMIRLVLGKQYPDDTDTQNRYTRAGTTLHDWLDNGTLVQEDTPGLCIYQMEFDQPDGGHHILDGIVCLGKVDEYGKGRVLPHEKTYLGPKQDQLNLMRACKGNITPIHALFNDQDDAVCREYARYMQGPPDQESVDAQGTIHRTWFVRDEVLIAFAKKQFLDKSIFIADGHHRYETAVAYRDEIRALNHSDAPGPQDWVMMYLTSVSHPGLTILPAHRMVKGLKDLEIEAMKRALEPYFYIEELPCSTEDPSVTLEAVVQRIANFSDIGGKFGMIAQGESCFRLLRLKDFAKVESLMDKTIPASLRGLDVTILREIIMALGLRMNGGNVEGHIEYAPQVSEVVQKAIKGEIQIGFILNPTRVDQMRTAAELGHKLPHKSTYFYPKISSGLALYLF
jgi:uncharacterized protein (DUF1015 family)